MIKVVDGEHVHHCDVCGVVVDEGDTFWTSFPREGEEENYKAALGDWGPLETGFIVCSRHQPNYNDGWWDDYRQDKENKV